MTSSVRHRTVAVKDLCSTEQAAERLELESGTIQSWKTRYGLQDCIVFDHPMLTIWDISKLRAFALAQKKKQRNAQRPILEGAKHGTRSTYNKGCRCEPCTTAAADYMAKRRRKEAK